MASSYTWCIEVLVLCTANQCRSPMAEALFRARLEAAGFDVVVSSAGDLPGGVQASAGAVRAMAERGIDIGAHVSQTIAVDLLDRADLVIGMGRRHVRSAVALHPTTFGRTFTLKELVRRATSIGPRRPGQSFEEWLAAVHDGRTTVSLLGDDRNDDVEDPMGGPDHFYAATAGELAELIDRLVDLAFASAITRETA